MRIKKFRSLVLVLFVLIAGFLLWNLDPPSETTPFPTMTPAAEMTTTSEPPSETPEPASSALLSPSPAPERTVTPPEKTESGLFCTLVVRCDDIFRHMDQLTEGKEGLVPPDGMIFPEERIQFFEGESAFDVLHRIMKDRKIHLEFVKTPAYNSVYVEGIGNLYEFDCGDGSGWTYTINGESPMHGASQHLVSHGDRIEFVYRCNIYESLQ